MIHRKGGSVEVEHFKIACSNTGMKRSLTALLEFSGPSGARREIHVCRTTTKRVVWRKRVRNQ